MSQLQCTAGSVGRWPEGSGMRKLGSAGTASSCIVKT